MYVYMCMYVYVCVFIKKLFLKPKSAQQPPNERPWDPIDFVGIAEEVDYRFVVRYEY